ncbi:MAG: alpha/beta hydrolase [Planctomycetota bacterium]|nr:alpha/beta hydrolase [Planctomycetota bacterium]
MTCTLGIACATSLAANPLAATAIFYSVILAEQDVEKEKHIELEYQERGIFMDPVTAAFIAKLEANPPAEPPTPQEARAGLDQLQSEYQMPANISFKDRVIPGGSTGEIPIRIYQKKGIATPAPAVVYFHGGGFVKGGIIAHARLVSELATCSDAVVVFVDYTLAPEGKYPLAHDQCYETLEYVYNNPDEFSTTSDNISIGGDSVGGAIAATCSLRSKYENGPAIRSQLLFYPAVELDANAIEYGKLRNGPLLTKEALDSAWSEYFNPNDNLADPFISPVHASIDQLEGMPPTLVITAQNDVLHATGEEYADKLIAAGVDVTASRYFGTIHDFLMLNALADTPAAKAANAEACFFLNDVSK